MRKVLFPVVAVLILAGAGYWFFLRGDDGGGADRASMTQGPVAVTARTLAKEPVALFEELPGRTAAYMRADIRPQVSGVITDRLFEEGGWVEAGQQLYQIDPAPYRAAYDSAKARLQRAEANVRAVDARAARYAELVRIDAVSKQDHDDVIARSEQAKADVAVARAEVETARVNLDYTKVYAPIAGRIGRSAVTVGALVTADQEDALATITRLDPIFVDLNQSSVALLRLRRKYDAGGDNRLKLKLFVEGMRDAYPHEGELQFSEVTVDAQTGTVKLRALFPNPDRYLLPGMYVRARVSRPEQMGVIVPQSAAIRGPDGDLRVWVINDDSTVTPRKVTTGGEVDGNWLVTDGVSAGERIALDGFQKIRPGATVTPDPENENTGDDAPARTDKGAP